MCPHMETAIGIMATNQSGQILVAVMAVQVSRRWAVDGTIAEEGYLWKAGQENQGLLRVGRTSAGGRCVGRASGKNSTSNSRNDL